MGNKEKLFLALTLIVTLAVFSPALFNGFTNWDDGVHLLGNPAVRNLDLRTIFLSTVNDTYIPLTVLSFALEHHFFGYNPFVFHLNNVVLHLAVTALVFIFAIRLGLGTSAAVFAGLLFGIHPIHVESVAWITERKDVLYAFFYMLSLIFYWSYIKNNHAPSYVLALCFAALSILSKAMALSLPLILFLLDWMGERKRSPQLFWDKIPFALIIVPVAWITYALNAREMGGGGVNHFLVWLWTFSFYIDKFFSPIVFLPLYQLPYPVSLTHPAYMKAVGIFLLVIFMLFFYRRNRFVLFAFSYYFLSIFFLLRFDDAVDISIVADRFMYLPSLGFCILCGKFLGRHFFVYVRKFPLKQTVILIFMIFLGLETFFQNTIWHNNISLWTHVIRYGSPNVIVYNNRATEFASQGDYVAAMTDYNRALAMDPTSDLTLVNRGNLYNFLQKHDQALRDYNQALSLSPDAEGALLNRAILYSQTGQYEPALLDFSRVLYLNPNLASAYFNRGNLLTHHKEYDRAVSDFTRVIQLEPQWAVGYYARALVFIHQEEYQKALMDLKTAQSWGYPHLDVVISQMEQSLH